MAQHRERGDFRDRRNAIMSQYEAGIISRTVPLALIEIGTRARRCHVQLVKKVVLCGVSDAVLKITHSQVVPAVSHRDESKVGISPAHMVVKIVGQREPQTLFEFEAPIVVISK